MIKLFLSLVLLFCLSRSNAQENIIQYRLYLHDQDTINQRDLYVERSMAKIDRIVKRMSKKTGVAFRYQVWFDHCILPTLPYERNKR